MAKPFNLTVAVNLQGPNNIKAIAGQIKKELSSIQATVKLDIKAEAAKNIANINKQLDSLSNAAIKAQTNVTNLGSALSQLSAGFNSAGSTAKQFNNTTAITSKGLKSSAKNVQVATTAIEEFGKQSALAVKRFAAFSIVTSIINKFTSAVSNGFTQFIEFDRQLTKIAQVTRASEGEISALSAEITSLAKRFGVSANSLAEVSLTLSQAGFSAEEARVALEALAKTSLAATFDDINSTTEGTIALLRQFSLSTSELEAALGSINAVAAAFAVESSDIITAIQRTGGVFASASKGVSEGRDALNEFIAVFTSVRATTRESAETIATGLRTIFTRIQRGSTIKFLKEFGIELQDSQGKFVGAYEAIRRLSEGLSSLDPRDVRFSQIVEELGGFRQIGKVIPLIQEFATAQEALNIAQKGSGSLSRDAIQAQSALAVQFARTREEFTGLIKEIGQSTTFKTITTLVLGLATAFIRVAGALKPILPLIAALTAVKGFKFITEFISGFGAAIAGGGGAKGIGTGIGGALTGTTPNQPGAGAGSPTAISANTTALVNLTAAVNTLSSKFGGSGGLGAAINPRGGTGPFGFGPNRTFARGGIVPGSGNSDTIPAMLTPGEFVIRKSSVNKLGANYLDSINKYGIGGKVTGATEFENYNITTSDLKDKRKGLTRALGSAARGSLLGNMFEGWLYNKYGVITQDQKFPDVTNVRNNPKALRAIGGIGSLRKGVNNIEFKYKKELESKAKYNRQYTSGNTDIFYAFAKGGGVGTDNIPALLTPGEFVVNRTSAQKIGYSNLNRMNKVGKYANGGIVQKYQKGGFVKGLGQDELYNAVFGDVNPGMTKGIGNAYMKFGSVIMGLTNELGLSKKFSRDTNQAYSTLTKVLNDLGINGTGLVESLQDNQNQTNRLNVVQNDLVRSITYQIQNLKKQGRQAEIPQLVQNLQSMAMRNPQNRGTGTAQTMASGSPTPITTAPPPSTTNVADQSLSKVINKFNAAASALAVLGPSVQDLAVSFDNLAGTSYATSSEMAGLSEALSKGGSLGLSASIAGGQLGGRTGAILGTIGLTSGLISGAIQGYINKEIQNLKGAASQAEINIGRGTEDFATAASREEQLQILDDLTASSIEYDKSLKQAAEASNSSAAKAARGLDIFTKALLNVTQILATRKALGRSSGGIVYAAGGTLVDYQPKGTDTIPAMLSKGEFVVNARSTKKHLKVLKAINRANGGVIDPRDTNKDGIVDLMELQAAGGPSKKLSDLPQDKFDFRKTTGRSEYAEAFYQTFMPSKAKSEGPRKDKALRYAARTAAGVGAAAGVAAGGIAAAPLLAGGAGTGGTALGVTKAADVAMSAGDVVDLGSALAQGDSAGASLAVASLGATLIPGSGVIKGGARAVKGAKTVTTAAKTASKAADAASIGKKATSVVGKAPTGPIPKPPPTPRAAPSPVQSFGQPPAPRTPVRPPPPRPTAKPPSGPPPKKGGGIFGNFFNRGPRPPSPPRTPGSPRRRGFGRSRGKGGKLAALADIFTIGLPLAQAGFDYFQGDVQAQALEQQALLGGFEQTSKLAGLRAQTLEPESLVGKRALAEAAKRPQGETLAQRRERLGKFTEGDIASGGLLAEQARQKGLKGAGFELEPGQGVEEFYQTLSDEQKKQADIAIQAADKQLKKQAVLSAKKEQLEAKGLGADQITRELNKLSNEIDQGTAPAEDLANGMRLMGREEDKLAKQLKETTAIKAFAKTTADLTAIMPRISAAMNRLSSEMDVSISRTNSYVAALQGNGSAVSSVSASIEQDSAVLENITAYSGEELSATLDRAVAGMGGGENVQQAAELVKAQQVLQKSRPSIEAAIKESPLDAGGIENVTKTLEKAFEGVEISREIKESFIQGAASSIVAGAAGGEGTQKSIDSFLAKSAQAQQLFEQYTKFAAEGLKKLAAQTDNLSQAMIRSQELQIESATLGIESGNRLKEALGKTLSTAERTASFDNRILSMTAINGRVGTADPRRIANRLRDDAERQRDIGAMEPGQEQIHAVVQESAALAQSISQNRKALELLARDTTRADAAIAKIAARDKQLRAQADTAIDLAADPAAAMEFLGGAGAISRVMSGQGNQADLKAGQAALKQLEGLLSPEEFQQLSDRFMQGAQQAFPELGGFALTGAQREADPQMQANIQAYNDAIATQQAALAQLQQLEQTTINQLTSNIESLRDTINTGLKTAVSEIEAELNKFKATIGAVNNIGVAGPAPNEAAALAPQPQLNTTAAIPPSLPPNNTAAGGGGGVGGTLQLEGTIPDKIDLAMGGTTNVVVTFNANDLKILDNIKEDLTKQVGSQIAQAINEQTQGGIRLTKFLS